MTLWIHMDVTPETAFTEVDQPLRPGSNYRRTRLDIESGKAAIGLSFDDMDEAAALEAIDNLAAAVARLRESVESRRRVAVPA